MCICPPHRVPDRVNAGSQLADFTVQELHKFLYIFYTSWWWHKYSNYSIIVIVIGVTVLRGSWLKIYKPVKYKHLLV